MCGECMTAPPSFDWQPGSEHTLEVPSPQFGPGSRFLFGRWTDDGRTRSRRRATRHCSTRTNFVAQYQGYPRRSTSRAAARRRALPTTAASPSHHRARTATTRFAGPSRSRRQSATQTLRTDNPTADRWTRAPHRPRPGARRCSRSGCQGTRRDSECGSTSGPHRRRRGRRSCRRTA